MASVDEGRLLFPALVPDRDCDCDDADEEESAPEAGSEECSEERSLPVLDPLSLPLLCPNAGKGESCEDWEGEQCLYRNGL